MQDPHALSAPDFEPNEVAHQSGGQGRAEGKHDIHSPRCGQGAGRQQERHRWDGETDLLRGYPQEENHVAIPDKKINEVLHVDGYSARSPARMG
jgi:hypothetical protein